MFDEIIKFKNVTAFFVSLGMKFAVLMLGMFAMSGIFMLSNFLE